MLQNGRLPGAMLATIPGTARRLRVDLVPQTAAMMRAFRDHFGRELYITDGYRTYEEQVILRLNKGNWAAVPGQSNHGWGQALDLGSRVNIEGSAEYLWMKRNGPTFGWTHPWWAENNNPSDGQQEPWHWEGAYVPPSQYGSTAPAEEDEMSAAEVAVLNAKLDNILAWLANGGPDAPGAPGGPGSILERVRLTQASVNGLPDAVASLAANVNGVPSRFDAVDSRLDAISAALKVLNEVVWVGNLGTPEDTTIYQRVARVAKKVGA
jgi:hypothetical protein